MKWLPSADRPLSCRHPRRGVATIWMLAVLTILTLVTAAITTEFWVARRLLDHRQNEIQAVWLARAGAELASAHLQSNPAGYTGESVELIPGSQVRIEVRSEEKSPDTFLVTSEARYPTDSPEVVVSSLTRRYHRVGEKDRMRIEVVPPEVPEKKPTP